MIDQKVINTPCTCKHAFYPEGDVPNSYIIGNLCTPLPKKSYL